MESSPVLAETERAVVIPPTNSFAWPPFANVTDLQLDSGHRTVAAAPGQLFSVSTDYFVAADPCIGCSNQLVLGVVGGGRECFYDGVGPVQSSAAVKLLAPSTLGIFPVYANHARTPDCAEALRVTEGGPAFGLLGVHGDPWDWGWGSVTNVRLNGNGSHKINVFPGDKVTITTNYTIDAAKGGCPYCVSQVVFGIEEGSKECIYSGQGVVNATDQSFSLTAPTQPGLYPVWAAPQWTYSCAQALSWSNSGTPVAFIEVK
ncbi:hypothetical protein LZ198_19730 [Myxococcus sp. K15C18031901]|uniref:hypothetical protein n=1 Tax=Myxococcus dinghuensis TaxID=2906761 RepID=UPI0020A7098A|nr:hypothetical protein [Myxococcus dinghuensis]MCP3101109.1 hypothetical protein [Myxococcus dinghuensis]